MEAWRPRNAETEATLLRHLVGFGRRLRDGGIAVNPAAISDLCRALDHVDIARRDDVKAAARATLIGNHDDIATFERIFADYWGLSEPQRRRKPAPEHRNDGDTSARTRLPIQAGPDQAASADNVDAGEQPGPDDMVTYSRDEKLAHSDLGTLDEAGIVAARRLILQMLRALMNKPGRRFQPARRGSFIDFRRSFRRNVSQGFAGIELIHSRPRIRKLKLIVLCDVSGSMARYAGFLLDFVYALRHELPSTEAAVFSTHMTPITSCLRTRDIARSLQEVAGRAKGWGGGTDIGRSLAEFNTYYARDMLRSKAIVVVLSDGWDRGDARTMKQQIGALRRRVHKLVWLNPLLGGKDYQPLCRGIRAALPHLDHFLPAHNLASLAEVAKLLRNGQGL